MGGWTKGIGEARGEVIEESKGEYEQSTPCACVEGCCETSYNVQLICGNKKNLRISISMNLKMAPRFSVIWSKENLSPLV